MGFLDDSVINNVGKIPWRKKWQLTQVILPVKSHGQRSLVGCSPWGHKGVGHDFTTKQQWLLISHNNNMKVIHEPWSGDWLGLTVLFCFHWIYFYDYYIFKANGINFSLMVLILILPFKLMSLGINSKLIQRKNIK